MWSEIRLENVLYVPKIRKNLFSVGVCTSKNIDVLFKGDSVVLMSNREVVAEGVKQENKIYRMFCKTKAAKPCEEASLAACDLQKWHERLGHVNQRTLREMAEQGIVEGFRITKADNFFCKACQLGKLHRLKFEKKKDKPLRQPGEYSLRCLWTDVG